MSSDHPTPSWQAAASPAPYPQPGPEQQDAIRRRALPIGICGAICGAGGLALLLFSPAGPHHTPSLFGVNLSFCAMMMGIGIIFYARRTSGTRVAVAASVIALLLGLAGPLIYAREALYFRKAQETLELDNLTAIANAAHRYAVDHGGMYPSDLAVLLQDKLITPETLRSPYEGGAAGVPDMEKVNSPVLWKTHADLLKYIDDNSAYQYFGGDLRLPTAMTQPAATQPDNAETFARILVVCRRYPIARRELSAAYADGRADFISLEEAEAALKGSNEARRSLGFAALQPPESVQKAMDAETEK